MPAVRAWQHALTKARCLQHPPEKRGVATSAVTGPGSLSFTHVGVLGGGVAGLCSAVRLLQDVPGVRVTLIAEKFSRDTTTAGAAGIWGPYALGQGQEEKVHRWSKYTYDFLVAKSYGPDAAICGTYPLSGYQLYDAPQSPPFWYDIVHNFTSLSTSQLQQFPPFCKAASFYTSVVVEGRFFLAWLQQQLEDLGGVVVQGRVSNLELLYPEFDVLVNCSGLQAKELVNDPLVQPIRGQIMRVHAPWVKHFYFCGGNYIVPNRDWVVLGGTTQEGDYNTNVSLDDRKAILEGCTRILPSLANATVLDEWVGLRPGRKELRLEAEQVQHDGKDLLLVHNYGHGGSGLTLGWGCAADVVGLVRQHLGR